MNKQEQTRYEKQKQFFEALKGFFEDCDSEEQAPNDQQ